MPLDRPKRRERSASQLNNILPLPIELRDGETIESHTKNHISHITDVKIGDHHLVTGQGAWAFRGKLYVVWQIKITINDLSYSTVTIYKRYREILQLWADLEEYYSEDKEIVIPQPPPKDVISVDRVLMSNSWLEERRKSIQWFLSSVLLNPVMQKSPVVKQFVLS